MGIPLSDYRMMQARLEAQQLKGTSPAVLRECELHQGIIAACNIRDWIPLNGSMVHRTHRPPGEPDFTIMADRGRTFYIEAKAGQGKLSMDQLSMQARARKLGHQIYVIRSMREFYQLIG